MAVNSLVVKSLKETYTRAQLVTARATAAADILAGIQVTQLNFEGGGAGGRPISGEPGYVLEHVQAAIDLHDDSTSLDQPSAAYFDLSKRQYGT